MALGKTVFTMMVTIVVGTVVSTASSQAVGTVIMKVAMTRPG